MPYIFHAKTCNAIFGIYENDLPVLKQYLAGLRIV